MSEKRKPTFIFLLKKQGKKTHKVEVFEAVEFNEGWQYKIMSTKGKYKLIRNSYRIRVDGKWWPKGKKEYFWKSEIRDLIFKAIEF